MTYFLLFIIVMFTILYYKDHGMLDGTNTITDFVIIFIVILVRMLFIFVEPAMKVVNWWNNFYYGKKYS